MKKMVQINENWQSREIGATEWLSAKVPGCVQLDLAAHGLLDDPYAGNEKATHDIKEM